MRGQDALWPRCMHWTFLAEEFYVIFIFVLYFLGTLRESLQTVPISASYLLFPLPRCLLAFRPWALNVLCGEVEVCRCISWIHIPILGLNTVLSATLFL